MDEYSSLSRHDLNVLLRIVGSRKGADFDALLEFVGNHAGHSVSSEQLQESLSRLLASSLIVKQGTCYLGSQELQSAFLNECRNCRDTFEEFDVLNRIISQVARSENHSESRPPELPDPSQAKSRWRGT